MQNLDQIVGGIQGELFEVAMDGEQSNDARVKAWSQAILMAPSSPKILEAIEEFLVPQLPGSVAEPAINALQDARVEGLSEALIAQRLKLTPQTSSRILTMLLSRAESTKELLKAVSEGKVQFTELQLDQRQALISHPDKEIAKLAGELMKSRGAAVTSNRQAWWMSGCR